MDPLSSFSDRLRPSTPFLGAFFAAGFAIAVWDPHPRLILTAAIGTCLGMLLLGPYAAAALYSLSQLRFWRGQLRWPLCLVVALSAALLLDYALEWTSLQFYLAAGTAALGTVLGHDATLAVLELRGEGQVDGRMVFFFPLLIGLAVLAGYCSLGFGVGSYQFLAALLR